MARYTQDSKERVRDAVDMVDLVSTRTELRRAGANRMTGRCPFHEERTPSFGINPTEKVYYCFGCQASGDAFSFVMESEGVDFKGALELLADRYAVELEPEAEDPREAERRGRRERLLALLERTAAFYERFLWSSEEAAAARGYLTGRGLGEEVLREFRVGYAPSAWDRVLLASRRGGFDERDLLEAGLAQRSRDSGRPYDRFRERIMFPLADARGRVLGFGARAMRENQGPKYLNSAEGELYHKGRQLYGIQIARAHASRAGSVVVCEGYTDVLALHQAGLRNAVGIMGTAITPEQVTELGRMAARIELALDADSAGQQAMLRAAQVAAGRNLELRVIPLPAGADPADLVAEEGAAGMRARLTRSAPFVRFRVEQALGRRGLDTPEGRDHALVELRPIFETLGPSAMREELARLAADRLELTPALVSSLLTGRREPRFGAATGEQPRGAAGGGAARSGGEPGSGGAGAGRVLNRRERTERTFLALCLAIPRQGGDALARLRPDQHFTSELLRRAADHLREHLDAPTVGLDPEDEELARLITELSVRAAQGPSHPAALDVEALQLELAAVDREIVVARASDRGDVAELATRRAKVKVEMDKAVDRAMASAAPSGE